MKVEEELLQYINRKRQEMIQIGLVEGLTSKETVKCSQELDYLLNLHRSLLKTRRLREEEINVLYNDKYHYAGDPDYYAVYFEDSYKNEQLVAP